MIDRGYVRPEDEAAVSVGGSDAETDGESGGDDVRGTPSVQRPVITIDGQGTDTEEDGEDDAVKPLPERLVIELTAHRTLARMIAVGRKLVEADGADVVIMGAPAWPAIGGRSRRHSAFP